MADAAIKQFTGKTFNDKPMFVCHSQSTFLLFVGNIPYDYTVEQFRYLMAPYGQIERIFIGMCQSIILTVLILLVRFFVG